LTNALNKVTRLDERFGDYSFLLRFKNENKVFFSARNQTLFSKKTFMEMQIIMIYKKPYYLIEKNIYL
jgi:hypothetical protein